MSLCASIRGSSNEMRYINRRFTYLLAYLITEHSLAEEVK